MFRLTLSGLLAAAIGLAADCEGLAKLTLPSTKISEAKLTPADKGLPAHCRVTGVITPSADSEIKFAVWMPETEWNGKFLGIGNGGFAGSIGTGGLAEAVRNGFAAASTDTGHTATYVDAKWALNHPEKIIDFGHRAIHLTAVQGKAITTAFYGSTPKKSYFSACSNGGRQALMEAQRYPEDYDGIIAGAPANNWTHLMTNAAKNAQATLKDPAAYFPAEKLPAIQAAALAACDKSDAVADGVIENPAKCGFDPSVLLCKGEETKACLTVPQMVALKELYGACATARASLYIPAMRSPAKRRMAVGARGSPVPRRRKARSSPSARTSSSTWFTAIRSGITRPSMLRGICRRRKNWRCI